MGLNERKERERQKRRSEILKAAKTAFLKHGIQGTTMDKIALEAELGKGTLYLYYSSKEELILALIAEDLEKLIEKVKRVTTGPESPGKKLLNAVAEFYGFSKREQFIYSAMTQLNIQEMGRRKSKSNVSTRLVCANQELMGLMTAIIDEGVARKEFFISESPQLVVTQIILALKGTMVMIRNGMIPQEWDGINAEEVLMNTANLIVRGLNNPHLEISSK